MLKRTHDARRPRLVKSGLPGGFSVLPRPGADKQTNKQQAKNDRRGSGGTLRQKLSLIDIWLLTIDL